ncbi:MAG: GNAT family N-acetyltransferase [Gammaproteobacteria bacterium]|jgi:GNAT superfamily N-acetyltransferase|nr:GNAT family N-acetyltransferase [Gammaproteobacteria bacterium]
MDESRPTDYVIRDALPADASAIANYNSLMAEETEGRALDPAVIGPGVAQVLTDNTKGRYWVAESNGEIVGQLMVTYEWSDWRNATIWWIQSVYVPLPYRRKGVFSALYRHVQLLAAAEPNVCGLRLYVETNNHRAQQTYAALGMIKPSYLVMESMLGNSD